MLFQNPFYDLSILLRRKPNASALLRGSEFYPGIEGRINFYDSPDGTVVAAVISGLPQGEGECRGKIFGFHIHEGTACTGTAGDPFADALTHYNPDGCPHPYHAGDMPPLFEADGNALFVFLTDRFRVEEIIGKAIVIHSDPDDFTAQPAGNAGSKIACGTVGRRK